MTDTDRLQTDIEQRLAESLPGCRVAGVRGGGVRAAAADVDHPDGVSLKLCEDVTRELGDLLAQYAIEVSSPGPQRPLTKPDHFRRFLGQRARVRTREPRNGHKSFTGELIGATEDEVTVAVDPEAALVSIPYKEISRSNLLERRGEEQA